MERRDRLPLPLQPEFIVSTKKKSCDLVHHGVAGPAPDQILDAIRAEYWLPASAPREPSEDTTKPDQPIKANTKVKP